ncbi:Lysozyme-like [Bacillus sp. OV322]|uniref:lysozyme family protein n=1 Tax=Bacillus sp. OV322 TaxID=1882764 RepID=UPI0008E145BB|nr:lysozyme family protein [Bacillus sp. OV322]SFC25485.1 Lysozyme-like [Bacillus sp. OV322]
MKKKKRKKQSRTIFIMLALLAVFLLIKQVISNTAENTVPQVKPDPYANVKKYTPLIRDELGKYHLQKYTAVLVALMQQESKGRGGDPMQASESIGLAPNSIHDPRKSIEHGIEHFHRTVVYGNRKKVDFKTIIQAYNMGTGYIDYVASHGGRHSEKLAKDFSMIQVKKKPDLYTCGGDKNNFRYPYCYGDFTYSTKVAQNIQALASSIPASAKRKTGESF